MASDREIRYLSAADLYAMAEDLLGRRPLVRDRRLLRHAAARPTLVVFGEEVFATLPEKAASLMQALAAYHPLYDGNKRLATAVTTRFLVENDLEPVWDENEIYDFVLGVAQKQWDVAEIAAWLAAHTRPGGAPCPSGT